MNGHNEAETRCLFIAEMAAQAKRCSCGGSDDYCGCQNQPDRETIRLRLGGKTPDTQPRVTDNDNGEISVIFNGPAQDAGRS